MARVEIYACGGTMIEGKESKAEIYTSPCDFVLKVEKDNGKSKKYRFSADSEGNLIVSSASIDGVRLISEHGCPALQLMGSY